MASWPVLTTIAVRVRLDPHADEHTYRSVHEAVEASIGSGDIALAIEDVLGNELMNYVEIEVS